MPLYNVTEIDSFLSVYTIFAELDNTIHLDGYSENYTT